MAYRRTCCCDHCRRRLAPPSLNVKGHVKLQITNENSFRYNQCLQLREHAITITMHKSTHPLTTTRATSSELVTCIETRLTCNTPTSTR